MMDVGSEENSTNFLVFVHFDIKNMSFKWFEVGGIPISAILCSKSKEIGAPLTLKILPNQS